jgi:hypothetical protein
MWFDEHSGAYQEPLPMQLQIHLITPVLPAWSLPDFAGKCSLKTSR